MFLIDFFSYPVVFVYLVFDRQRLYYAKSSVHNNNKILHFGEILSACVCLLDIILIKSVPKIGKL